jgi:hypothetical protein
MAGMVAIASPQRLTNVVLFGFAFDPELEFGDAEVPPKPDMLKNTTAAAASDFISPKVTPKEVDRRIRRAGDECGSRARGPQGRRRVQCVQAGAARDAGVDHVRLG